MKLYALMEHAREYPIFTLEDCCKWFPDTARSTMILQLSTYVKRGLLARVKRGLYMLADVPEISPLVIASRIDTGSFISIESVLYRAGIIPESTFGTTALTTGRTRQFTLPPYGIVRFRHIKQSLNFGWNLEQFEQYSVRVATPEKALLDLLWFHRFEPDPSAYIQELRLDLPTGFSWDVFGRYSKLYSSRQIDILAGHIMNIHHDHKRAI